MVTDLEQQIRELAASRLPSAPRLGNGPAVGETSQPSIFFWLEQIRESLANLESLALRSEALTLNISGRDSSPHEKQPRDLSDGSNLATSIEMAAHRLKMANSRIDIALTVSERAIGGTNS